MRGRDTYQQHHSALVCWQCDSVIPRKIRKEFKKHATSHRQKPRWYIGWQNFCVLAGLLLLLLLFSPDRIHINNSTIQNLVQPGCPAEEKINICQVLKCIVIKQTRGWILPNVLWSLCHSQLFLPIRFSPVAVISCACSRLLSSHLDMKIAITELGATKKNSALVCVPAVCGNTEYSFINTAHDSGCCLQNRNQKSWNCHQNYASRTCFKGLLQK